MPIPFDIATPTPPPSGTQQAHYENAVRILDAYRITDAKLRQTILASAAHIAEVNRFSYDLQRGTVKANKNPAGLLLVRLGLRPPKASKPA